MPMSASQVIVVVGASSGMGRASALRLASDGHHVLAVARRGDRLEELRDDLQKQGHSVAICAADTTTAVDVERIVASAIEQFGRIDTLVYATGTNIPSRSLEVLSAEDWELLLRTNLTGAFLCTKAVLPVMRRQQSGLIVYLSTGAVQYPDVSGVAYQASKHGLNGLSHGTRVEEKRHGIRTTILYPGLCDTEILLKRPVPTPKEIVEKALRPQDVADVVAFLCTMDPRCHVPEMQLFPALV
jgi:NAD(P)-dependent dehydrogenase (short-subunit alcohol dehydrogenase family)